MSDTSVLPETICTPAEALGHSIQWLCSPRGGNNFYGRVINGCKRRDVPGLGTCGVSITEHGNYVLGWDPEWFASIPENLRLLVILHEAGHLVLRHVERGLSILFAYAPETRARIKEVLNIAQDLACNDIVIRPLLGDKTLNFDEYKKNICFPEHMKWPQGKTMEEYFMLLLDKLKEHGWTPDPDTSEECQGACGDPG